ncbi:hypothetical protein ACIBTZ_29615, partial [Micromonospora sp. NPDC049460]|uniref:hypothetical protein n=1 Tax=unclassified Micromonospora TaxID=2617518 RepID=UPI0037249CC8
MSFDHPLLERAAIEDAFGRLGDRLASRGSRGRCWPWKRAANVPYLVEGVVAAEVTAGNCERQLV